jgi:hypothetical protein
MNVQTPLDNSPSGPADDREVAEPDLANPVSVSHVVEDDDGEPTSLPGGLPSVPRPAAVRRLAEQLTAFGMNEGGAAAVARAVARPEEARRRLQNPDVLRVPGGELDTISVQVWTPAVSTFPGNNREAGTRIYPLSGGLAEENPAQLGATTSQSGIATELVLEAQSPAHVVSSLGNSAAFLAQNNDLSGTIGQLGILRDVFLTVGRIEHEDKTAPRHVVWSDDGSSRLAAAHRIVGVDPEEVVYRLPADDRAFRGLLGGTIADALRAPEELTAEEARRVRALVAPATIVLRFRPEEGSLRRYDQAVRFVVGITHVEPPKAWGAASENDALADAVIEEFIERRLISQMQAGWLGATITVAQASQAGFDGHEDTRVADIVATFLLRSAHRAFGKGVRRVTAQAAVRAEQRARVTTELILRPWRSGRSDQDRVAAVRSTLQRAYTLSPIADGGWRRGTDDPDKLLDEALRDLAGGVNSGPAGVELAIRGGYWLAVYQGLRRDARASHDQRPPSSVLQKMTESEHGLRVLHAAIISGRTARRPERVDANGALLRTDSDAAVLVNDEWLRQTFPSGSVIPDIEGEKETPGSKFERARRRVGELVDSLESSLREAETVEGHTGPYVRDFGWPTEDAEALGNRLNKLSARLAVWGQMYAVISDPGDSDAGEPTANSGISPAGE